MRKIVLAIAVVLGFSATGFGQTELVKPFVIGVTFQDETTRMVQGIIENENVTIVPGELVIIRRAGINLVITKQNGVVVGKVCNAKSDFVKWTGACAASGKVTYGDDGVSVDLLGK